MGALIGRDVTVINKDGSGRGPQKFIFWNPPFYVNEAGFNVIRSTFGESLSLFLRFVQYGLATIAFTRVRQAAERMQRSGVSEGCGDWSVRINNATTRWISTQH